MALLNISDIICANCALKIFFFTHASSAVSLFLFCKFFLSRFSGKLLGQHAEKTSRSKYTFHPFPFSLSLSLIQSFQERQFPFSTNFFNIISLFYRFFQHFYLVMLSSIIMLYNGKRGKGKVGNFSLICSYSSFPLCSEGTKQYF